MVDIEGDTYRAVYAIRYQDAVYVLRAFQKKSKRGIRTPQRHVDLIRQRLKLVERAQAAVKKERKKG